MHLFAWNNLRRMKQIFVKLVLKSLLKIWSYTSILVKISQTSGHYMKTYVYVSVYHTLHSEWRQKCFQQNLQINVIHTVYNQWTFTTTFQLFFNPFSLFLAYFILFHKSSLYIEGSLHVAFYHSLHSVCNIPYSLLVLALQLQKWMH